MIRALLVAFLVSGLFLSCAKEVVNESPAPEEQLKVKDYDNSEMEEYEADKADGKYKD